MDKKSKIKEEDVLSDDGATKNETELFHEVVIIKNCDDILLDDDCSITIKTEINAEIPFTKCVLKQSNCETVTCSNNWKIGQTTEVGQQFVASDSGSQSEGEFLLEEHVMKNEFNSDQKTDNKIEIKEEPWWLETETSSACDDIKDGDFPPIKSSRSCDQNVFDGSNGESLMLPVDNSGNDISFNHGKDLQEIPKIDVTEIPTVKEYVPSEQFGKCSGERMYVRPISFNHEVQRPHKCSICAKSFNYISHLKAHNLIHEGKKIHQCKTCDKAFTRLSDLNRHSLTHEGKKPYQCKTCEKRFTELSNLKTHYLIHEGKKPHKCSTCGKSFTQLSNLKTHNLVHVGKKIYECKSCNMSFTRLSNLKQHNFIHEGIKPHKCTTCGKSFTHLSLLKRHNLIHEGKRPYICPSCDKSFMQLSHLKKHQLIHEGKKPFNCNTCDRSFSQLSDLKRHSLTHEGKKPHECKSCDKSFIRLSSLKQHNLIHEGKAVLK